MSKELTPLKALCYLDDIAHGRIMKYDPHELKLFIEESLKALKVIKEKRVDIGVFRLCENADDYNRAIARNENGFIHYKDLTQQEYDLLKKVLL